MFTLQTSFKLVFFKGEGGVKSVAEVTVNSKGFCPNSVQEFDLRLPWKRQLE
jgi:hypothetical protein